MTMKRKLSRQVSLQNCNAPKTRQVKQKCLQDKSCENIAPLTCTRVLRKRNYKTTCGSGSNNKENAVVTVPAPKKVKKMNVKKVLGSRNVNDVSNTGSKIIEKDDSDVYDITLYLGTDELPKNSVKIKKSELNKSILSRSNDSGQRKNRSLSQNVKKSVSLIEGNKENNNVKHRNLRDSVQEKDESSENHLSLTTDSVSQDSEHETSLEDQTSTVNSNKDIPVSLDNRNSSLQPEIKDLRKKFSALMSLPDYFTSTPDKREFSSNYDSSDCSRRSSGTGNLLVEVSPIKVIPQDVCYSLFNDVEYPELAFDVKGQVKRPKRDYSNVKGLRNSFVQPIKTRSRKAKAVRKSPEEKKLDEWMSSTNNHFEEVDSFELCVE